MRWSQLRKLVENIWVENLPLAIHCSAYRTATGSIGRYWVKLGGSIIWSEPENIDSAVANDINDGAASEITGLIREYLDLPKDLLLEHEFANDRWGIIDIMRAADRRIGKARLIKLKQGGVSEGAERIINARLNEFQLDR